MRLDTIQKIEKALIEWEKISSEYSLIKMTSKNIVYKHDMCGTVIEKTLTYFLKKPLCTNSTCVSNRRKQTMKEKYGNKTYRNTDKANKTKLERYNDENYNNMEKNKETKKDRYGDENFNNPEQISKSLKEKYKLNPKPKKEKKF